MTITTPSSLTDATLVQALTSISAAHFRHVRHTLLEAADGYLLNNAAPPLRDLTRRSMTQGSAQGNIDLPRPHQDDDLTVGDIYQSALWLAKAREITMIDAEGQQHKALPDAVYAWPSGERPDALVERRFYQTQADAGVALAVLALAQIHARAADGLNDWSQVHEWGSIAALYPQTRQRAMRLLAESSKHTLDGDARITAFFWSCAAHLFDPSTAHLPMPGRDYFTLLSSLTGADLKRLETIIAEGGPDMRLEPCFTMEHVRAIRIRTHGALVPGTEPLAGAMRVRLPTAQEAAPKKLALLADIHRIETDDPSRAGPIAPKTANAQFLSASLLTLSAAHLRYVRRHLHPSVTEVLGLNRHDALSDLTRQSMTAGAWQRLLAQANDEPLSETMRQHVLAQVYAAARWLADEGDVRMVDLNGKRIGGDKGVYAWPTNEDPDPIIEVTHYQTWDAQNVAFATLAGAQIHLSPEDGLGDPTAALDFAERAALGPRTLQRALYLLADLYAGKGPTTDHAKAYFYADIAERKDPYAAEMFGRRFDRWHHWEALTKKDIPRLSDLMDGPDAAHDAFKSFQREMSDGTFVMIERESYT